MIGLATGAWAEIVANNPWVERFTIVEINPGYLDIVRKYPVVSDILVNPKVEIVVDDGRRWLNRHPESRFDAIIQNTTWHYRPNVTNLLSREYLQLVRKHLMGGESSCTTRPGRVARSGLPARFTHTGSGTSTL